MMILLSKTCFLMMIFLIYTTADIPVASINVSLWVSFLVMDVVVVVFYFCFVFVLLGRQDACVCVIISEKLLSRKTLLEM